MYFLEGASGLLDQRGEWSFSVEDQKLRIRTPNGRSPLQQSVTHKTQVFAFNISNSPYLILANMTFLGTTINAAGNIPHLVLDSLRFRYPSFSRRMLGDLHTPAHTVLSAISTTPDPEPGPTPQPAPPPPLASCIAAERQWCPHLAGAGVTCEKCVMKNQRAFQQAGCFAKHARHAFLTRFCDPDNIGVYETTAYLQGKPSITAQQSTHAQRTRRRPEEWAHASPVRVAPWPSAQGRAGAPPAWEARLLRLAPVCPELSVGLLHLVVHAGAL